MIDNARLDGLLDSARAAASRSYSPYSKYRVGAAVLTDIGEFTGANIENAASNLGICAERVAIACALMSGAREIFAVAVCCVDATRGPDGRARVAEETMPCGACRQWLAELAPNAQVITNGMAAPVPVSSLLPMAFSRPEGAG